MNRWFTAGFLLLVFVALALRLPELALRPMHNDEAVNAMKFRALWVADDYKYDPNEFHGPTLPYFTLPSAWSSESHHFNDFTEITYRRVTVAFGIGLVFLFLLLRSDFGKTEVLWASAFVALSPAMVFYSRYYIHEMLLVFFTALAGISAWRYFKSGKWGWSVVTGVGLGLMAATKETFVLALASLFLAVVSAVLWTRWKEGRSLTSDGRWTWKGVLTAFGMAVLVTVCFFSSFFTNAAGVLDAVKTYEPWIHRAGGATEHAHSWNFYFQRLLFFHSNGGPVWSEGLIVGLAFVGFVAALFARTLGSANVFLLRIIAFYTAWLTLIYTGLSYKTPWCLLGFYHGMIFLAALGATLLVRWSRPAWLKTIVLLALGAGVLQLGWQAWRGNFGSDKAGVPYCDSAKNPYTYSQTQPDIFRLMSLIDSLAHVSPQGDDTVMEVMSAESYWPLPWYLRRYQKVGFWDKIPVQPLAPIIIVSSELHAAFDEGPKKTHLMAGYFELRPGVFFEVYVNLALWTEYVKTEPREAD